MYLIMQLCYFILQTRLRYLKAKREFDDMQVTNQIYLLTSTVQSDKKDKHKLKYKNQSIIFIFNYLFFVYFIIKRVSQTEREV